MVGCVAQDHDQLGCQFTGSTGRPIDVGVGRISADGRKDQFQAIEDRLVHRPVSPAGGLNSSEGGEEPPRAGEGRHPTRLEPEMTGLIAIFDQGKPESDVAVFLRGGGHEIAASWRAASIGSCIEAVVSIAKAMSTTLR